MPPRRSLADIGVKVRKAAPPLAYRAARSHSEKPGGHAGRSEVWSGHGVQ
jgi:hypothetical protein